MRTRERHRQGGADRADDSDRRPHGRAHRLGVRDRRRRAAGPRPRARRRPDEFGKGLVQGVYNLDGGYALKLTTGKWFTPSGRTIQRPRKFVNGQFVEEQPDTSETNASKKTRPAYKSDAGRTVYGGGGITPDVIVQDDTLTTTEQQFTKLVAPKSQDFFTVSQ